MCSLRIVEGKIEKMKEESGGMERGLRAQLGISMSKRIPVRNECYSDKESNDISDQ